MFGTKRVALLAAAIVAGSMLSFSGAPASAQALRLGLVNADMQNSAAAVDTVAYRGGPYRGGGVRMGGPRYGGGARMVGPRYGGARYVGPRAVGPRYVGGYHPGFRPGPVRPGWGPGRPGWGPGGPGWGHPGWRPPPGAWGPGAWRPGWGWYRPGWGWGYYNNSGAWIALGVASGLALGAVAATAEPVYGDDAVAYCAQRYRSYNPATGTYTGYDGYQHPCP
ncbi:BA14K family protein [Xanthobacter versatilis]|uniref:BA14K family protein n=2 Tax=Xanthobacter autotrophicus (strain ATCC BAA-1158 / Py2) TaxID=78245 RepID=UPI00006C3AE8